MHGNPARGGGIQMRGPGTFLWTMTIMRAASALCLLVLSGCAAGMQQSQESILHPGSEILQINGTLEPVTFAIPRKRVIARVERPHESILRPRPSVVQINGTVEPVAFVVDRKQKRTIAATLGREPCQTNDPMPTGRFEEPVGQILNVRPLRVAPMPNACPVTVPLTSKTVVTSAPLPPKTVPAPTPTEPQP
jgi:hypothetical protein